MNQNLSSDHLTMLRQSAISDAVLEARGYRTITGTDELTKLGFAPVQCRVPGLLLPLHGTNGGNSVYVFRPDNPRVVEEKKKGKNSDGTYPCKVIKYEYPKGEPMHVDCPPMCRSLLGNPKVRLWITEGQKKADALASIGECAIALLGVWNFKGKNEYGGTTLLADFDHIAFEERDVRIVFDSDVATKPQVHQALQRLSYHLREKKARVSVVYLPAAPGGAKQGVDDFLAAGNTLENLLAFSQGLETASQGVIAQPPSQTTLLIKFGFGANLFHTEDGEPYATIPVGDHLETWHLRNQKFKQWLARQFYAEIGRGASAQAMQDALAVLEARALFDGQERQVFTRLAESDGALWLDLTDTRWRAVEITAAGWRVIENPPVRFRRARGMLPIPMPTNGGKLGILRDFLNIASDDDWISGASWLVAAGRASGPFPSLVLYGEQGSAKTTFSRVLRMLIDPNVAALRAEPRDVRDLVIAATNAWIVALDNVSSLPVWLSDALCRLSTGGGFATRQLYTDSDETIFDVQRPVILNGIEEIAVRGDLLDRSIILYLPSIPEAKRRAEADFWSQFEQVRPQILGALLDVMAFAQRESPSVKLTSLPRMADFAKWSVAAAPALGWTGADFLRVYGGNRATAYELTLDASPITEPLRTLIAEGSWSGTATELLTKLNELVDDKTLKQPGFPKNARGLSNAIRRLAPTLRAVGISVTFGRQGKDRRRTIELEKVGISASASSASSASADLSVKSEENADANSAARTQNDPTRTQNDPARTQNTHADAKDAKNPALSDGTEVVEWSA